MGLAGLSVKGLFPLSPVSFEEPKDQFNSFSWGKIGK